MGLTACDSPCQPAYLAKLNGEQRRAVEHGGGEVGGPLLIIAGAVDGRRRRRAVDLFVHGGEVRNILDFPKQFPLLERNYRSTDTILAAANAVIGEASERFAKNLWSERKSAERPKLVQTTPLRPLASGSRNAQGQAGPGGSRHGSGYSSPSGLPEMRRIVDHVDLCSRR